MSGGISSQAGLASLRAGACLSGFAIDARVHIGRGRAVWRVLHSGVNSAGRVLVQSETSGLMKTVPVTDLQVADREIRCDYCGDALPSVKHRSHIPTTPDIQRLGFSADKIVCPECVDKARTNREDRS